jgi:hypothetical protein
MTSRGPTADLPRRTVEFLTCSARVNSARDAMAPRVEQMPTKKMEYVDVR